MDPLDVRCPMARRWLSALRDGETGEDPQLRAHVQSCTACQRWDRIVDALTRRVRVHRAGSPDVAAAAVQAFQTQQRSRPLSGYARWLLGFAGVMGLVLAAFGLVTAPSAAIQPGLHLGHDVYSFESALALGFLLTALHPDRYGRGLLPVTATAALLTVLPSVALVAADHRGLVQEMSHLPMLVGLVGLLLLVAEQRRLARGWVPA
jgi:predicted anti-sigma-YlaC factor YlaD